MNLHCTITFEPGAPPFRNADLHLRLEDTSETDTAARPVAQTTRHGVNWTGAASAPLEFDFAVKAPLVPGQQHQLRAHLDLQRTGQVTSGDFVTTQSYPVNSAPGVQRFHLRLTWLRP